MEKLPWQLFDCCWEPDEGMLAELKRDGMVAWARREQFHSVVTTARFHDAAALQHLQQQESAIAYGYGSTRPLVSNGETLDGEVWVKETLPALLERYLPLARDPDSLNAFEKGLGEAGERIANYLLGKTAHRVAAGLCEASHPLNQALREVVDNDMGIWLAQERGSRPNTPLGLFLDRGANRAIAERMRQIQLAMALAGMEAENISRSLPLHQEQEIHLLARKVLWGQNGLAYVVRGSMAEFLRERVFDLGTPHLFGDELHIGQVGCGYWLFSSFWRIVSAFINEGKPICRRDVWLESFDQPWTPYGYNGASELKFNFRPNAADWGLLEAWIWQIRFRQLISAWDDYPVCRAVNVLFAEIHLNHNVLLESPDHAKVRKGIGVFWESPIQCDHPSRYLQHEVRVDETAEQRRIREEQEREEPPNSHPDWLARAWLLPLLDGLLERMHTVQNGFNVCGLEAREAMGEQWDIAFRYSYAKYGEPTGKTGLITELMRWFDRDPELLTLMAFCDPEAGEEEVAGLVTRFKDLMQPMPRGQEILGSAFWSDLALWAPSTWPQPQREDCIRRMHVIGQAYRLWVQQREAKGEEPCWGMTLREAMEAGEPLGHPGYEADLQWVLGLETGVKASDEVFIRDAVEDELRLGNLYYQGRPHE